MVTASAAKTNSVWKTTATGWDVLLAKSASKALVQQTLVAASNAPQANTVTAESATKLA